MIMDTKKEEYSYQLLDRFGKLGKPVIAETLTEAMQKLDVSSFEVVYEFYKMAVIENKAKNQSYGINWVFWT